MPCSSQSTKPKKLNVHKPQISPLQQATEICIKFSPDLSYLQHTILPECLKISSRYFQLHQLKVCFKSQSLQLTVCPIA